MRIKVGVKVQINSKKSDSIQPITGRRELENTISKKKKRTIQKKNKIKECMKKYNKIILRNSRLAQS